ncbi:MAG: flavin reductase family protein [Gemmatimonadota bacterium]|nr:flavin reductase family protein [Gemmatimonadota bacterium]MDH5195844.1 flavin reductase family protein [Gemmatimonadota bacterium]
MDPIRFRQLLGSFATGVAVVTARDRGGAPTGMTASAIASVSLEPPLLLVCVWEDADFHAVIAAAEHFCLNILAEGQGDVSRRFATDTGDRFATLAWQPHATGVPVLADTAAHIVCARHAAHTAGDHTIFVGRVIDGRATDRPPLLHVRGAYRRLR